MENLDPQAICNFISTSIIEGAKIIKRRFPNLTVEETNQIAAELTNMHQAYVFKFYVLGVGVKENGTK